MLPGLFLGVAVALSSPQDSPDLPRSWTEPAAPVAIADGLYQVGSAELTSFLFVSDEGHILIDVLMEENVGLILGNIRKLGFDPPGIQILLAGHSHFDHVGGLATMKQRTGATLVLSAADAELVDSS